MSECCSVYYTSDAVAKANIRHAHYLSAPALRCASLVSSRRLSGASAAKIVVANSRGALGHAVHAFLQRASEHVLSTTRLYSPSPAWRTTRRAGFRMSQTQTELSTTLEETPGLVAREGCCLIAQTRYKQHVQPRDDDAAITNRRAKL